MKILPIICLISLVLISRAALCESMGMESQESDVAADVYGDEVDVDQPSIDQAEDLKAEYKDANDDLALQAKNQKNLDDIYKEENPDVSDDVLGNNAESDSPVEEYPSDDSSDQDEDAVDYEEEE